MINSYYLNFIKQINFGAFAIRFDGDYWHKAQDFYRLCFSDGLILLQLFPFIIINWVFFTCICDDCWWQIIHFLPLSDGGIVSVPYVFQHHIGQVVKECVRY